MEKTNRFRGIAATDWRDDEVMGAATNRVASDCHRVVAPRRSRCGATQVGAARNVGGWPGMPQLAFLARRLRQGSFGPRLWVTRTRNRDQRHWVGSAAVVLIRPESREELNTGNQGGPCTVSARTGSTPPANCLEA